MYSRAIYLLGLGDRLDKTLNKEFQSLVDSRASVTFKNFRILPSSSYRFVCILLLLLFKFLNCRLFAENLATPRRGSMLLGSEVVSLVLLASLNS
jgi:hypothetical protein